jgi:predicted alpha-1,6-mannanase (GH76 family)
MGLKDAGDANSLLHMMLSRFVPRFCFFVCMMALCLLLPSCSLAQDAAVSKIERVERGTAALLKFYNWQTGLFDTTGWWNSANSITVLDDASALKHRKQFAPVFANTFVQAQTKFAGFLNEYYDDEGWWALAWIGAYDRTGDKRYLKLSQSIFADMSGGWDDHCGGGIWWSKDRKYKNAIANELFLSVAASLALHAKGAERQRYLDWATREWAWFRGSGMINADSLVNDGLDDACHNNGKTTWSYNQGVILGGLAGLNRLTHDDSLLQPAHVIAVAAIGHLTDTQGVLRDACEPKCGGGDVPQFKGIFARNLIQLQKAAPDPQYRKFIDTNADAVWTKARTGEDRFGLVWSGPPAAGDAATLTSALDVLVAAAKD